MQSNDNINVIAIDGPAASGKTTIGKMLADHLGYLLLDTGCMYRAVTLAALEQSVDILSEPDIVRVAEALELEILPAEDCLDQRMYTVLMDGRDVTWALRQSAVDLHVSQVSAYQGVRENLVSRQRAIAMKGNVVVVGRDIGTVVLPDSLLKLYIVASAEERARRRWQESLARDGYADYEKILEDIKRRDEFDGTRRYAPMRPADDAIRIDTSGKSPEEILELITSILQTLEHKNSAEDHRQ